METQEEIKTKKALSDKKVEALKKARVALVKSRDEKRKTLHESALNDIVERKVNERLEKIKAEAPHPVAQPPAPHIAPSHEATEDEIIEIVKRPKQKKKIIVVESSSSESESEPEPVYIKPKHKPKKKVVKPVHREKDDDSPATVEYIARNQYQDYLLKNIFGR